METYEAQSARASYFANEMARTFKPGHDTEQSPQYEANRLQYLRAEVVKMWVGVGLIPPPGDVLG